MSPEERSYLFQDIINNCQYILKNDPIANDARSYLNSRIPSNFQNKFEFGYFPDNINLSYLTSLSNIDDLKKTGAVYSKTISGGSSLTGHFNNHNLIFPFKDVYGNIISLIGRTLFDKEKQDELQISKYKYSFGLNKELYVFGLDKAKKYIIEKDFVIVVEGQLDYFSCVCAGINNVVALGGASLSRYQFFKLRRYTKNFMMLLDNDEAGQRGIAKSKKYFGDYAKIISKSLPNEYKDIDETLSKVDIYRREQVVNNLKEF